MHWFSTKFYKESITSANVFTERLSDFIYFFSRDTIIFQVTTLLVYKNKYKNEPSGSNELIQV